MEHQHFKKEFAENPDSMSNEVVIEVPTDSVKVKQEPGVKLEPDEVDTIEYTVTSNQLDGIFVPKVEKIEPGDDNHDEVDGTRLSFDQMEHYGSSNFHAKNGSKSSIESTSEQTECASSETHRTNEESVATKKRGRGNFDGVNKAPAMKPSTSPGTSKLPMISVGNGQNARRNPLAKQHKCSKCEYTTLQVCKLKRHMLTHRGEKLFPCKNCSKRFTDKQNLRSHMKVHVTKDSLNCSICWQIFATDTERLDHELTCEHRRYECHLCKKFTTLKISELKLHMRVHNGERPFQCDRCSIKFTLKPNLKRHTQTHTKSRPEEFRCSVCVRNFLKRYERDAHELNCKRRRYECYLCQSYMACQKFQLQSHMRKQHTGERPFKCSWCEKCYAYGPHLKHHMKNSCKK